VKPVYCIPANYGTGILTAGVIGYPGISAGNGYYP